MIYLQGIVVLHFVAVTVVVDSNDDDDDDAYDDDPHCSLHVVTYDVALYL